MSAKLLINNESIIVNIIIADESYIPENGYTIQNVNGQSIGQIYDSSYAPPSPPPIINPVPDLTARQFLSALTLQGIITESEAMDRSTIPASIAAVFNTLPPTAATVARITWANMTIIPRQDPLIDALGATLNMTPTQIDDFFRQAATL